MAETLPQIDQAEPGLLRRLSQVNGRGKVISIYLNLDPSQFVTPSARESQIRSVLKEAADQIEDLDTGDERVALRKDLESVERSLSESDDFNGAASVAVFRSSARDLFRVVKVLEPLETSAHVGEFLRIFPLVEVIKPDKWCVTLIDRRNARLFTGTPAALTQVAEIVDDVHSQHDQGGWSQARYQRSVEEEVEDHLKGVAQRLFALHGREGFDRLVIGAAEELWPRVAKHLHPYLAEKLVTQIEVDVQNISVAELEGRIKQLQAEGERRREAILVKRLRQELGSSARGASGLHQVLDRLNDASVETLLIDRRFDAAGVYCPECGYLAVQGKRCPADGEILIPVESIVEKIIERSYAVSAEVVVFKQTEDVTDLGGVAALLRFQSG